MAANQSERRRLHHSAELSLIDQQINLLFSMIFRNGVAERESAAPTFAIVRRGPSILLISCNNSSLAFAFARDYPR